MKRLHWLLCGVLSACLLHTSIAQAWQLRGGGGARTFVVPHTGGHPPPPHPMPQPHPQPGPHPQPEPRPYPQPHPYPAQHQRIVVGEIDRIAPHAARQDTGDDGDRQQQQAGAQRAQNRYNSKHRSSG